MYSGNFSDFSCLKISFNDTQAFQLPLIKEVSLATDEDYYRVPQLLTHRDCL